MKTLLTTTGIALIGVPILSGSIQRAQSQMPPATPIAFEVASIKPSREFRRDFAGQYRGPSIGGMLTVTNASLKSMIRFAFGVQDFQVSGGPKWIESEQYDTSAKMEGAANPDPHSRQARAKLMLQTLLADSFKLRFHRETRDAPGYELVVARSGAKLHKRIGEDPAESRAPSLRLLLCNGVTTTSTGTVTSTITAQGQSMVWLAGCLSEILGSTVVDGTSLTGAYDFTLTGYEPPRATNPQASTATADLSRPSIFNVLQEQLGLRLESQKVPTDVIVIDSAERPSQNEALVVQNTSATSKPVPHETTSSRRVQTPVPVVRPLTFEVASIKPMQSPSGNRAGCHGIDSKFAANDIRAMVPLGRCIIRSARLDHVVSFAYGVGDMRMIRIDDSISSWVGLRGERYDIEAKAENPLATTESELRTMLQHLLMDRFKLQFHMP